MQNAKLKIAFRIIFVMMLIGVAILGVLDYIIPESISVFSDSTGSVNLQQINLPFISTSIESVPVNSRVSQGDSSNPFYVSLSANTKMFGILPLKKVNVDMFTDITLYPGGMPFGVKLYTDGVIVVGISGVENKG